MRFLVALTLQACPFLEMRARQRKGYKNDPTSSEDVMAMEPEFEMQSSGAHMPMYYPNYDDNDSDDAEEDYRKRLLAERVGFLV